MSELFNFLLQHEENFRRVRLPSLYSDFRSQQAINPDGYKTNLSAWEIGLTNAAQVGLIPGGKDILSLRTGESLLHALETREWGRPLALTPVIALTFIAKAAAVAEGRMIPLPDFLNLPTSIYERKGAGSPWFLVSWTLRQLGLRRVQSVKLGSPTGRYVLVGNVEKAATKIMKAMDVHISRIGRILPMHVFAAEIARTLERLNGLSDDDLNILLVYLSRDKGYLAYNAHTVKLRGKGDGSPVITAEDANIASLKSLMADLNAQLETLNWKVIEFDQKARSAVANQNRVVAVASLRSKKLYETVSIRRSETLSQLEGICTKIEEAADQIEVMKVMEASSSILKGLNTEIGGVETVEEVLGGLRNEIEQVSDVEAMINEAAQATVIVDEGAIDKELEALERPDQAKDDEKAIFETKKKLELLDRMVPLGLAARSEERIIEKAQPDVLDGSTRALSRLSVDSDETRSIFQKRSQELAKQTEVQQT
ncbi:hypothetical protein MMC17_001570 [Xylographa soralifera]|nr:hypothetical protein [Xylographa soralifera]